MAKQALKQTKARKGRSIVRSFRLTAQEDVKLRKLCIQMGIKRSEFLRKMINEKAEQVPDSHQQA